MLETLAAVLLGSSALFWLGVFRYYRNVSIELSQYAQPPLKSPSTRAAIVSLYGFSLAAFFVFSCILQNTYLSDNINRTEFFFPLVIIGLLSICSPFFNCLSVGFFSRFSQGEVLTMGNASLFLACFLLFLVPPSYVFYKSRKEIELRFQMAVSSPPKKLYSSFKRYKFAHGNPVIRAVLGALRGLILCPLYLYYDMFKTRQGTIAYQKSTIIRREIKRDTMTTTTAVQKIKFDVGQQLSAADEATMAPSETPTCPKCKKPLVFLEDQEKWWCKKCKRAAYVR
jgi:hypothetical protein